MDIEAARNERTVTGPRLSDGLGYETRLKNRHEDTDQQLEARENGNEGDRAEVPPAGREDQAGNTEGSSGSRSVLAKGTQSLFEPIPQYLWECTRVRAETKFIGRGSVKPVFDIPRWWPNWLARLATRPQEELSVATSPRPIWKELPIIEESEIVPPEEEYVVLGIFGSNDMLLEEVIVYIGESAKSYHLYHGQRHLFKLPFLRDVIGFGLYKCDQEGRSHVRVKLNAEDKDRLNCLFAIFKRWSAYHNYRDFLQGLWAQFPFPFQGVSQVFGMVYTNAFIEYYRRLGVLNPPNKKPKMKCASGCIKISMAETRIPLLGNTHSKLL